MNVKSASIAIILALAGLTLAAWCAPAGADPVNGSAASYRSSMSYRVAQMEPNEQREEHHKWQEKHDRDDDWYQGQRGHWDRDHNRWQWHGAQGDEWWMGQRGHWYQEQNGWAFGSDGLVCNDQGRNCRQGGYVPPNGEGMVNRSNPKFFWACDSEGHKCHWAHRPL